MNLEQMWGQARDAVKCIDHVKATGPRIEALVKLQEMLAASGLSATHDTMEELKIEAASLRFGQWVNDHHPKPKAVPTRPKATQRVTKRPTAAQRDADAVQRDPNAV